MWSTICLLQLGPTICTTVDSTRKYHLENDSTVVPGRVRQVSFHVSISGQTFGSWQKIPIHGIAAPCVTWHVPRWFLSSNLKGHTWRTQTNHPIWHGIIAHIGLMLETCHTLCAHNIVLTFALLTVTWLPRDMFEKQYVRFERQYFFGVYTSLKIAKGRGVYIYVLQYLPAPFPLLPLGSSAIRRRTCVLWTLSFQSCSRWSIDRQGSYSIVSKFLRMVNVFRRHPSNCVRISTQHLLPHHWARHLRDSLRQTLLFFARAVYLNVLADPLKCWTADDSYATTVSSIVALPFQIFWIRLGTGTVEKSYWPSVLIVLRNRSISE